MSVSINDSTLVLDANLIPLGYQQMTSITVSTALPSIPVGAKRALIQAETQNVRWRDDGTAPTGTVGQIAYSGLSPFLYEGSLSAFRVIQATSGAILNVTYYE